MRSSQRHVSQFLLISGRAEIIRRLQSSRGSTAPDQSAPRSPTASSSPLEPIVVTTIEAAERALHRAVLDDDPIRVVVVDSTWLAMPGTDVAALLWARHTDVIVVDCISEVCDETIDAHLESCVQPRRFAVLRVPFSSEQAALLIRNLIRSSVRDEQFATSSRSLETLQERTEQLEAENAALTAQLRRHALRPGQVDRSADKVSHWSQGSTPESTVPPACGPAVRRTSVPVDNTVSAPQNSAVSTEKPRCQSDESRLTGRVLVADDHPASLRLLRFLMERVGIEVTTCQDGFEALRCYEQSTTGDAFDIVILDILMPSMNGMECARHLREAGYVGPLLAVTGRSRSEVEDTSDDAFDEWLTKPLDRNEFVSKLRELLAARTATPVS